MPSYYVDPAAGGANNGTSWTDAWTNFQSALDSALAGDTVYMRGTQVLAAIIDDDTKNGTIDAPITYIGVNASGTEDGTQFILNGNSAVVNCVKITGRSYKIYKNIQIKNATGDGLLGHTAICNYLQFYNITTNTCGGDGVGGGNYIFRETFTAVQWTANNNTSDGIYFGSAGGSFARVKCLNNGGYGLNYVDSTIINALMHNNTAGGVYLGSPGQVVVNCIIDSGTTGIYLISNSILIANCRITNCTTGISTNSWGAYTNCFFYGNTTDVGSARMKDYGHNRLSPSNTSDGYENRVADDFDLSTTGNGVGVEVKIGDLSSTNLAYITQGLPPQYSGGGAKSASMRGGFING